jgi:hypothetical protein
MNEYTYEIIEHPLIGSIKRVDSKGNESWVPRDPANVDYQAYLASLEATEPEEE